MNKRIRKKHQWLGVKRAGANYCANEIARHIGRKLLYSGITPKPSYILNVRRHVRWFFHHSSEEEWSKRVASAKHLLPADPHLSMEDTDPIHLKDVLEDLVRKAKEEE